MKKTIYLLTIIPVLILGAFAQINCSRNSDKSASAEQQTTESNNQKNNNSSLFEFSSETVDGSTLTNKDLEGNVVLFNYWGTWCPPCIEEIPHFQETYEKFKEDGFTIVGIAIPQGNRGGMSDVQSFMKDKGMTYPVIMQEQAPTDVLSKKYGQVRAVPTSILIDQNGNHVETFVGYTEKKTLVNALTPLLENK